MTSHDALIAAAAGLLFGGSLIVAIGAQNVFVLRQGLLREHRALVVATCALSDIVLIVAGVAGAGAALDGRPSLTTAIRLAGAAFLVSYGLLAARRAWRPQPTTTPVLGVDGGVADSGVRAAACPAEAPADEGFARPTPSRSALAVLATTPAFTWLNPHVYLDTLLLVGSAADARGDARWWFAAGTGGASVIWFTALGFGSSRLRPWFERPAAWRILDGFVAAVMLALGISLAAAAA